MNCLKKLKSKHTAWSDPSDPEQVLENLPGLNQEPQIDRTSSDDDDDDLYSNDVRKNKHHLETKNLIFKHLTNINNERSYKGAVKQVQFHPKSKIALVTVAHGQADLYEVDGERNRYIQNIMLPKTKRPFCLFKPDGESIVISSENFKGIFFTYDMVSTSIQQYALKMGSDSKSITDFTLYDEHMACRKEGEQEVFVLSSKTYENKFSIKINEPVKAIQFTDKNEIFVAGENARVYVWDLRKTSLCKHRFQDEGSVHTTSLGLTNSSKQLSIGSDSGIVNLYDIDHCLEARFPTPIKTFDNLKTSVDILKYNNTGELLLMASNSEPGAFRLIHSHSGLVYRNFPVSGKKYGSLLSCDFSPLGGYLALGCSTGRAHLCRIPYYNSY